MSNPVDNVADVVIARLAREKAELTTRIALVHVALADAEGSATLGVQRLIKTVREALNYKSSMTLLDGEQE